MAFCSSKHPTYGRDMSFSGLLPDGGVRLPPGDDDLPALDPKHKAVILYFYYMAANVAAVLSTNEDDTDALLYCPQFAISVFLEKEYGVKIKPDDIREYYCQARDNVEKAGSRWDQYAVAEIISRQVTDEKTFDEITSFVTRVKEPLSLSERFILDKVYKATRSKHGFSIMVRSYRLGAVNPETRDQPKYSDPQLSQSHNIDPKKAINYEHLCGFEHYLAEAKRYCRANTKRFLLDD